MVKLHGKKFPTVLCLLCLMCFLLSLSACLFHSEKRYQLISDGNKNVSWVSGTSKDCICVVFGDDELVIYTYKGEELLRKRFDKRITYIQTHQDNILLTYEDNSLEMYRWLDGSFDRMISQQFSDSIKKAELLDWGTDLDGVVVLLTSGDLYRSDSYENVTNLVLVDHDVKTSAYYARGDYLLYITQKNELKTWCFYETFHICLNADKSVLNDIQDLQVALFNDNKQFICFKGIGARGEHYFVRVEDNLTVLDGANVSVKLLGTTRGYEAAYVYQKDEKIYYQGPSGRKNHDYTYSNPYRIKIDKQYSLMPINGGVVYYNENEVNVLIVP